MYIVIVAVALIASFIIYPGRKGIQDNENKPVEIEETEAPQYIQCEEYILTGILESNSDFAVYRYIPLQLIGVELYVVYTRINMNIDIDRVEPAE